MHSYIYILGKDPRTDVNRAMKMFAILQVLHLVDTYKPLASEWFKLSQSFQFGSSSNSLSGGPQDPSWPFMCVSILFTKEVIQCFRSGVLNSKCNKHNDILSILHDLHHAIFHEFARYVDIA